jgi:hypothetical protein
LGSGATVREWSDGRALDDVDTTATTVALMRVGEMDEAKALAGGVEVMQCS